MPDSFTSYPVFTAVAIALCFVAHFAIWRHGKNQWLPFAVQALTIAALCAGWFVSEEAGKKEFDRQGDQLIEFATNYAAEMQRLGHGELATRGDDEGELYLALIAKQIEWLAANPLIHDVYTIRKTSRSRALVVDSETDYDGNGKFEGDLESRSDLGERYDDTDEELDEALADGVIVFIPESFEDRWGIWYTAYAPMFKSDGSVDAVLGVDVDADAWDAQVTTAKTKVLGIIALGLLLLYAATTVAMSVLNKNAERRLREVDIIKEKAAAKFETLVNSIQGIVFEWNPLAESYLFVSAQAEEITGMNGEAWLAGDWQEAIPEMDLEQVRSKRQDAAATGKPYTIEFRIRDQDGEDVWLREKGTVAEEDGETLIRGVWIDITENLRLESQLQHAQKMEAVGQLAAGVAHDFNNILTIIQGNLSLHLLSENIAAEERTSLNQMLTASERAATLTRQLLTFSRKNLFQPQPVELDKLVERQMKLLQRMIGETIQVTVDAEDDLPRVIGDEASIEQIMMNLAINARDSMPSGGRLSVAMDTVKSPVHEGEVRDGSFVRISVKDTGSGIEPAVLDRMFEPFYTTKEVGAGTGMGLATVYGILQQHTGWISVESTPGEGTTFSVFLPATETPVEKAVATKFVRTDKVTLKVLLVEDEPAVRAIMNRLLLHCGCDVIQAEDADQGFKAWEDAEGDFDLLVSDIVMPGEMSGHDLAKKLVKLKPELKVILCSGYSAEHFNDESALVPGQNFLTKPYNAHAVIDLVHRVSSGDVRAELTA